MDAQIFAPDGAIWVHGDPSQGRISTKVEGDTIIDSQPCKHITRMIEAYYYQADILCISNSYFLYTEDSVVYLYFRESSDVGIFRYALQFWWANWR